MSDRDYYEILGLTPGADGTMVDQAYWHLARKYQVMATEDFHARYLLDELNEAYGVLGTPRLREQYDAFRDDVLIRRGMIQPVTSRGQQRGGGRAEPRRLRLPRVSFEQVGAYGVAAVIVALAVAGAWYGVELAFVATAVAGGLGFALIPVVRRRAAEVQLRMPSLPALPQMPQMPQMPQVTPPKISLPQLSDAPLRELGFGGQRDDEGIDADTLRQSTADTIARWRRSVGLRELRAEPAPDTTLVDIVDDERSIEAQEDGDPLESVLEILRRNQRRRR